MAASCMFRLLALALLAAGAALASSCEQPAVTHSVYTAADAHFSSHGIVSITFSVQCTGKGGKAAPYTQDVFAVFRGRAVQAAQDLDSSKYQVTFSEAEKVYLPSGTYTVDLYDEDAYALFKKAQRDDSATAPLPMTRVEFDYPRVRRTLWVHSETLAVLSLLGASFYAYTARKAILS